MLFDDKKIIFYDCEIINCIPSRQVDYDDYLQENGYSFCDGWHDFKNMGISVIAAWTNWEQKLYAFGSERFLAHPMGFENLVEQSDLVVGFNSISFDDNLCAANNIRVKTTYDLLSEIWVAAGMPPTYTRGVTRAGYKLENLAKANLGRGKSGSGELAPILWQDGKYWDVIHYCLDDVVLLRDLFYKRMLTDPTDTDYLLQLRDPFLIDPGFDKPYQNDSKKIAVSTSGQELDDIPF